jgi:hypothetical protein
MWSLTIVAGIIFRTQFQDTLSDVVYNPTILDITSSGQGTSRWKWLCFKVYTANLQDFDLRSSVVAFPSKEYTVEVQQTLIDTKVHRFVLFLAPGVPCVLDIGSGVRFECVNLLSGTLAFHPEFRGSTVYQGTIDTDNLIQLQDWHLNYGNFRRSRNHDDTTFPNDQTPLFYDVRYPQRN